MFFLLGLRSMGYRVRSRLFHPIPPAPVFLLESPVTVCILVPELAPLIPP